ncbi:hypothetical protein PENTCL1PPCAC_30168 [Pristionchus entomophagus]|uniref:Uncharacterized protein n=1 Tax=Pristionchus entomophagus TaxID=358040 RepID=A0AAV5UNU2_9BILA|nr:hypothetical protein PENTCL1PPCAC_30168 [Pristionchus entomophagus]
MVLSYNIQVIGLSRRPGFESLVNPSMALDDWETGLPAGLAMFAFLLSLIMCTLCCCADAPTEAQEETSDDKDIAEDTKLRIARCYSVDTEGIVRSTSTPSPHFQRAGRPISRVKDPCFVLMNLSIITEESASASNSTDLTPLSEDNYIRKNTQYAQF